MKEATGELNMTVVTVVAIAAVGVFFYTFIWPGIQRNLRLNSACSAAGNGSYTDGTGSDRITCNNNRCTLGRTTIECRKN